MLLNENLKLNVKFLFTKLYNFWINYLSLVNFLNLWNYGTMVIVCLILQIAVGIFLAMYYKSDFIVIIIESIFFFLGSIFLKLIKFFNIKFYAYLDILTFIRKYSTIIKQNNNKKLSLRDKHPVLFDFFKINKKVYYVDINLTHSEFIEGHTTYLVGKDKNNEDIYVVIDDIKIKEISNNEEALNLLNNLRLKYKDFDATIDYDLDQLNHNLNLILLDLLKNRFGTNDIFSLSEANRSILDFKINLLSDENIFKDNLLWSPLKNVVWKTLDNLADKID